MSEHLPRPEGSVAAPELLSRRRHGATGPLTQSASYCQWRRSRTAVQPDCRPTRATATAPAPRLVRCRRPRRFEVARRDADHPAGGLVGATQRSPTTFAIPPSSSARRHGAPPTVASAPGEFRGGNGSTAGRLIELGGGEVMVIPQRSAYGTAVVYGLVPKRDRATRSGSRPTNR
jgi:hypothetical protein